MNTRTVGTKYEQCAAKFLESKGYEILEKNFRCRFGEIDLIAKDKEYLVFVEVKYRSTMQKGMPQEAVNMKKQRVISKVAMYYCMKHNCFDVIPSRFDVVAVLDESIELFQNAFEFQN